MTLVDEMKARFDDDDADHLDAGISVGDLRKWVDEVESLLANISRLSSNPGDDLAESAEKCREVQS